VIATNVGDSRRIVSDCGIIIEPGDPDALADAIRKLKKDQILRHDLGRRAQQRIIKEFSLQRMISAYRDFYYDPQYFVSSAYCPSQSPEKTRRAAQGA